MRRIGQAALVVLGSFAAAPGCADDPPDRSRTQWVEAFVAPGAGGIRDWQSVSTYGTTSGGAPLWRMDIGRLKGRAGVGFGVRAGARRGSLGGELELAWARLATVAQTVDVSRDGQAYDPGTGYVPLTSGPQALASRWLAVSSGSAGVNAIAFAGAGVLQPYLGLGLGLTVMTVSSDSEVGPDGGSLDATRIGLGAQALAGLRLVLSDDWFVWAEARPVWHLIGPYQRGTGFGQSRDQFVLELRQVAAGAGRTWW